MRWKFKEYNENKMQTKALILFLLETWEKMRNKPFFFIRDKIKNNYAGKNLKAPQDENEYLKDLFSILFSIFKHIQANLKHFHDFGFSVFSFSFPWNFRKSFKIH